MILKCECGREVLTSSEYGDGLRRYAKHNAPHGRVCGYAGTVVPEDKNKTRNFDRTRFVHTSGKRFASPQAWRRVRINTTDGERADIARDIAQEIGLPTYADAIARALTETQWERRKQA